MKAIGAYIINDHHSILIYRKTEAKVLVRRVYNQDFDVEMWCDMTEDRTGFYIGSLLIPFTAVKKI